MLKNSYENIVVGKNYLSYLFSTSLLKRNKSLLLIDDERVRFGEHWFKEFGELEKNMLTFYAQDEKITPLLDIESLLKPNPFFLHLGQKVIRLGENPYHNLLELIRKLPQFFSDKTKDLLHKKNQKDFDRALTIFYKKFSSSVLQVKSPSQINGQLIDKAADSIVRTILNDFVENFEREIKSENNLLSRQFFFILQSIYQSVLTEDINKFQIQYLFIQALSPYYRLKEHQLNELMANFLEKMEGDTKTTNIQYWQYYQHRICSVLLASYEGVIHPSRTYYLGNTHNALPFELNPSSKVYSNINLYLDWESDVFQNLETTAHIFSDEKDLGTDFPASSIFIKSKNSCKVSFMHPQRDGSKPDFFKEFAIEHCLRNLEKIVPLKTIPRPSGIKLVQGQDIWISKYASDQLDKTNKGDYLKYSRPLAVVKHKHFDEKVRDFEYWGPLQYNALGLFSFLVHMKQYTSKRL